MEAVRILSQRIVRPSSGGKLEEDIHLTPWDLRLLTIDHIQKGIVLPKPPFGGERLMSALASSLARALSRYYHFAGRLAVKEHRDGTVSVTLRCTGEGAELVHAVATKVAVADIVGSVYSPSPLVWAFFTLNGVLDADAAIHSLPVISVQVTELADGIFIAVSMNHSVGDGTSFWEFLNEWSKIHRGDINAIGQKLVKTPAPVHGRWFADTSPLPIHLPISKLQHILRPFKIPPVREGFFTFSAASVKKLKAKANDEMAGVATATISSLQAILAHVWRAVCRARRLPRGDKTFYSVIVGCRERVRGIPLGYVGNCVVPGRAVCAVGEILDNGLGWTAWQINRTVASLDEAALREFLGNWVRKPQFSFNGNLSASGAGLETGSSPRFDVFGNDFGWGRPLGVRSGAGQKTDGKATVFEGPERGGSMSLEVCLAPDTLEKLVADDEFMEAVSLPTAVCVV